MRLSALNALNFLNEKIGKKQGLRGILSQGKQDLGWCAIFLQSVGVLMNSTPPLRAILYPAYLQKCQFNNGFKFFTT